MSNERFRIQGNTTKYLNVLNLDLDIWARLWCGSLASARAVTIFWSFFILCFCFVLFLFCCSSSFLFSSSEFLGRKKN